MAEHAGVPFVGLWLEAPSKLLATRLGARRGDASDADTAVLRQQLDVDTGTIDWSQIDATGDMVASLAAARALIDPPNCGRRSTSA